MWNNRSTRNYRSNKSNRSNRSNGGQRAVDAQLRAAEMSLSVVVGLLAGGVFAVAVVGHLPMVLLAVPIALVVGVLTAAVVGGIRRRALASGHD